MKKTILILLFSILVICCSNNKATLENTKRINDSIQNVAKLKMEEMMKPINMFSDTTGTNCPIDVYSAQLFNTGDYNNSKGIKIKYRNISYKTIVAVSFTAYVVDAFNEPVNLMGKEELNGIITTRPTEEHLRPGKSSSNKWNTRNNECRKIVKVNAFQVAFSDGEVWDLPKIRMQLFEKEFPSKSN